jgi:hypothetical protein
VAFPRPSQEGTGYYIIFVDDFVFPQPRGNRPGRSGGKVYGIDVGARVVRGSDGCFIDEDGGAGCVGTITRQDTTSPNGRDCFVSDYRFTLLGGIRVCC